MCQVKLKLLKKEEENCWDIVTLTVLYRKKLLTLSDCMTHKVMVPFTSKAFMPGKLVHTNEILVLLGDNWFIETSSKRAADIASRRIEQCDKMLQKIEDEVKLIEGWQNRTDAFGKESEECVDIRE